MAPRDVRTITVLGAGDMGHGVAELAALRGFDVRVRDVAEDVLAKARDKVNWSLAKLAEKSTITADAASAASARIVYTSDLARALDGTDFVIEAVPEKLELKQRVFADVERLAPAHAVLASNTSTMRIGEIGSKMADPTRLVGMHFFNPVLLMDLVEIIPGERTSREVVETTQAVAKRFGKTTVTLAKDTPGFVTSRLIGIWVGAGVIAADRKLATKEQVDSALKFGAGFPMGPHELADYTGIDIGYHASEYIASRLGPAYKPGGSLAALAQSGKLGKKTGTGYYTWEGNRMVERLTAELAKGFDPAIVMAAVANEAAKLLDQGVASAADIDLAMRNGTAFPKGPLEWADQHGLDRVLRTLVDLKERTGEAIFEPYELLVELVQQGHFGKSTGRGFYAYAPAPAAAQASAATPVEPTYATVLVEKDAATKVGVIAFNRPHRLHAINGELLDDVERAFRALARDEDVRCIVVTATGDKAFSAGADLMDSGDVTAPKIMELSRRMNLLASEFERCGKPVVAAINGMAFGGGMEWTLACDFRVAAKRAKMGLTEVTLGLVPAGGGTQRLPKLVGLSRAKEIVLLGEKHSAEDMQRFGVVHRVFENESFEKEWRAFAAKLAAGAPIAQALAKRALSLGASVPTEQGIELEATAFGVVFTTEDAMEGVSAMFSKRQPEFKGK